jgi:hypothetical protein
VIAMPNPTPLSGQVRFDGRPVRDAEVLLVDGTAILERVTTDASGRYAFTVVVPVDARVMARLRAPVIGVWISAAAAPCDFAITTDETTPIRIDFQAPAAAPFDWLDVKLTPRRDEVPPRVILAVGPEPGLAEAMFTTRLVTPSLEARVRRGLYDFRAYRIVETSDKTNPTRNLTAERVVTDGPPAVPRFGGFEVQLGDAHLLAVGLRQLRREEL